MSIVVGIAIGKVTLLTCYETLNPEERDGKSKDGLTVQFPVKCSLVDW